ncbi:hypothetical protein DFJ74DRAFT_697177 [Hyaloraphidium curvatum]|nr:hypothetical protein DFJ74DRAFT_697177 [Hyaloraphidium curvatum]
MGAPETMPLRVTNPDPPESPNGNADLESAIAPNGDGEDIANMDGDVTADDADAISSLPPELALRVFATLAAASIKALCTASAVSRTWHRLATDAHIWRDRYVADFGSRFAAYDDPGTTDCAADAVLPLHPLTDLSKAPRLALDLVPDAQLSAFVSARDRAFGLVGNASRLPGTRADLLALALLTPGPCIRPPPPFSSLAKLSYHTALRDARRSLLASARELSRMELRFRFKDHEEDFAPDPFPDRRVLARFRGDGTYESEWVSGEKLRMRWRFAAPAGSYDPFNYVSSGSDGSDDPDYAPSARLPRRSRRAAARARVPPALPAINMPNLSGDRPWERHSRVAVEDYPVLTAERVVCRVEKGVEAEEGIGVLGDGQFLGWKLENDCGLPRAGPRAASG